MALLVTLINKPLLRVVSVIHSTKSVTQVQKLMKKEGYDEGLLKLAEMIYKSAFRKNSVMLLCPFVAHHLIFVYCTFLYFSGFRLTEVLRNADSSRNRLLRLLQ